ncbi:MAG: rRNA maturation RNase YbeY [Saprospiraceae bacterium]|nr:rRNA maturation RNase YbeY [Saprospiraceae bacterium]
MDTPKGKEILFHNEEVDFKLPNAELLKDWIQAVAKNEGKATGDLNIVLCSDAYLHSLNIEFLGHDTLTDIITFPFGEDELEGDIFISLDRIRENAQIYKVDLLTELHRVIIHGVLHLCGYTDNSKEEQLVMRQKEDDSLALLNQTNKQDN